MSFFLVPLALIIFLAAFMLVRTLQLHKIPADTPQAEKPQVDREKVSRHLSGAIQVKTISKPVMTDEDRKVFRYACMDRRNLSVAFPNLERTSSTNTACCTNGLIRLKIKTCASKRAYGCGAGG